MQCALRPWRVEDAADLARSLNNKKIMDNLRDGLPYPYTKGDALEYINAMRLSDPNNTFAFAITVEDRAVGSIGAFRQSNIHFRTAELGYYLAEKYWGKGLMTQAVRMLCRKLFDQTDILRIYAEPFSYNTGSRRVLEKAGFSLEGIMRSNAVKNGRVLDMALYALTKETAEPICEQKFYLDQIPAVLYGEPSDKAYLFVHGMNGCKEEAAAFAEIACPKGYQVLAIDLPEHGERKEKKERINPWTAVPELSAVFSYMKSRWSEISIRANSIGAHFSMLALESEDICKALFLSPIVDMERLIADMMGWAGVSERELRQQGEIVTDFGQTLSWDYLAWEREHSVSHWRCPTAILYAGGDNMTDRQTVEQFSAAHNAELSIMESGEHWFHTPEQLSVLKAWERENV